MCFRSTVRISFDPVTYFDDPDQRLSFFRLKPSHVSDRIAQSVAERGDPIPEPFSQDDSSISEELLYEVSSLQFHLVSEPSKESLSSSCVEDAVPDKLSFALGMKTE
jgi:hypothetical protein